MRRAIESGRKANGDAERLLDLLVTLLGSLFREIVWDKSADRIQLTYSQWEMLFYVAHHPGTPMSKAARAFRVSLPSMTQTADRLEQKGFVSRGNDPRDRRVSTLSVTEEGKRLVAEIHAKRISAIEVVLTDISAKERARLLDGLSVFVDAAVRRSVDGMENAAGRGEPRAAESGRPGGPGQ